MKAIGATSITFRSSTLLDLFRIQHVVQGIVQGAEVRIDLLLQRAWQEAKPLACFDCGPCQNDPRNPLSEQRRDSHRDGEIRLTGTSWTDAEDEVVPLNCVDITPLVQRLWRQNLLTKATLAPAFDKAPESGVAIGGQDAEVAVQVAVAELMSLSYQVEVVQQDTLSAGGIFCISLDLQGVIEQASFDFQTVFKKTDIFIAGPEKGLDAAAGLHAYFHLLFGERFTRNKRPLPGRTDGSGGTRITLGGRTNTGVRERGRDSNILFQYSRRYRMNSTKKIDGYCAATAQFRPS
jgi:hypothetical protein